MQWRLPFTVLRGFAEEADRVGSELYDKLIENPDLLPPETCRSFFIMQFAAGIKDALDFSNCDFDARCNEIESIKKVGKELEDKDSQKDERIDEIRKELLTRIGNSAGGFTKGDKYAEYLKWIYLNRTVADYLGGMTDTMAKDEYRRICQHL